MHASMRIRIRQALDFKATRRRSGEMEMHKVRTSLADLPLDVWCRTETRSARVVTNQSCGVHLGLVSRREYNHPISHRAAHHFLGELDQRPCHIVSACSKDMRRMPTVTHPTKDASSRFEVTDVTCRHTGGWNSGNG